MGAHESRRGSDLIQSGRFSSRWLQVGGGAALLLLGPWILVGRQAGIPPTRSIYYEDGAIFLQDGLDEGLRSVATPYAGYLHVVPRWIAVAVAQFDLDWWAVMLVAVAGLVLCVVAWSIYVMSGDYIQSHGIRSALALSVVFLPVAQREVYNNVANLHWFLLYLTFWVLLWQPQRWLGSVSASIGVLLVTLSSPFTVLLAPLAAYRLRSRTPKVVLVVSAYTVGTMVQMFVALDPNVTRQTVGDDIPVQLGLSLDPLLFGQHYLFHVIGRGTWGSWAAGDARGPAGYVSVAVAIMLVILVAVLWRTCSCRTNELVVCSSAAASVLSLAVPWSLAAGTIPARYLVAPVLFYYVAMGGMIDDLLSSSAGAVHRCWRRAFMAGVLALAVFVAMTNYRVWSERSVDGDWPEQVQSARQACIAERVDSVSLSIFAPMLSLSVDVACEDI